MGDTKTCPQGHVHDRIWTSCPYCEKQSPESSDPTVVAWMVALSGSHKGQDFRVLEGTTIIGKDPECDIILEDEYVSGRHARIEGVRGHEQWRFVLTDLGSTNGTQINDSEQDIDQTELHDDDFVTIGSIRMKFKALK